jgi:hypothetical protein
MESSDPTVTISCDGELVIFTDDADSPSTQPEVVTIPLPPDPPASVLPKPTGPPASERTPEKGHIQDSGPN